jgi:molecular chaperone DnaK
MNSKQNTSQDKLIVGIDLGTTYSGIAIWDNERQQVRMLEDANGYNLTPSMVGWDRLQCDWVVGRTAKALVSEHPGDVAYSIKRYIGRWFTDPNISYGRQDLSYKLVSGGGKDQLNDVIVDFGTDEDKNPLQLSAPQVSSKVLLKLRHDAARELGVTLEEIKRVVITVPAYFNVLQRKATIAAAQEAEFEEVYILNEPTAAALAYSDVVLDAGERRILIYDLGGGTFDISLLEVSRDETGYVFYTVVIDGDTRLGGDDIDISVAHWLATEIEKRYGHSVRPEDRISREHLRRAAEQAKIDLSAPEKDRVTVELPALDLGNRTSFDAHIELSTIQLEKCAFDVIQRTRRITQRAVEEVAGLKWNEIDEVILVGGQTLMPAVQREVEAFTGHKPRVNDRPQLAVALGAGEYAHILSQGPEKLKEKMLINVIALPLGILLDDNTFEVLVPANKTVPHRSNPYPIAPKEENQSVIYVHILQGSRDTKQADQCVVLDTIKMEVKPTPFSKPKFEVVFDVQSDGTMKVIVTDTLLRRQETLDIVETKRFLVGRNTQNEKVTATSINAANTLTDN